MRGVMTTPPIGDTALLAPPDTTEETAMTDREKLIEAMAKAIIMEINRQNIPIYFNTMVVARAALTAIEAAGAWQPIRTAPDNVKVLLFCPRRGPSNPERVEMDYAISGVQIGPYSSISRHPWATHWQYPPAAPSPTSPEGQKP